MLTLYITIPLVTALALIQEAALAPLSILGGRPDLVFIAVAVWAFLRGPVEGSVWAFFGGIMLDLFSGGPFGAFTLALVLVSLLMGRQWGQELGSTVLQLLLLTLINCFVYHIILLLTLLLSGYAVDWSYGLSQIAAPSALLNAVLAPFAYWPLAWLDRRTRPEGFTLVGT